MNCRQATSLFNDSADGTLSAALATGLESHLANCGSCAEQYESLSQAVDLLAIGDLEPTSRGHVDAVMTAVIADIAQRRVSAREERRRVPPLWLVVASHVAAAAIGAVIVWGLIEFRGAARRERVVPLGMSSGGAVANAANGQGGEQGGDAGAGVQHAPLEGPPAETDVVAQAPTTRFVLVPLTMRVVQRVQHAPPDRSAALERELERNRELQSVQTLGALANVAGQGARALLRLSQAAALNQLHTAELAALARAESARYEEERASELANTPDAGPAAANLAALAPRGAVVVARDTNGVVLLLRGELDDVVPALINLLASADPDVREAVERRLIGFANDLGLAPPRDTQPATSSPWWRSDRGRAADFAGDEIQAATSSLDPSVWRAWWNSARVDALAAL